MKFLKILPVLPAYLLVACLSTQQVQASTFSITGVLSSPTNPNEYILTLPTAEDVILRTFGFGGGTNAAGTVIPAGGTDPLLAVFSGLGDSAPILTDGSADPYGTSLAVSNYGSFQGCPPANSPTFGGSPQCGDVEMDISGLSAGTYTILLGDGQYIPDAIFDNGTLGEGYSDFTGGQFCNIDINNDSCTGSGAFALDIITSGTSTVRGVPEPSSLLVFGLGIAGLLTRRRQFVSKRRGGR